MRGYYKGRYGTRTILAVQAEYQGQGDERIGVVGFAGVADVFPGFADLKLNDIKYSLGTGVRYMVNKREGTNLRMDMAWGRALRSLLHRPGGLLSFPRTVRDSERAARLSSPVPTCSAGSGPP